MKNEGRVCGYPPLAHPGRFRMSTPLDRSLQTEPGQVTTGVTGKARDPSKRQRKRSRSALLMVGVARSTPQPVSDLRTYASTGSVLPFTRNSGSRSTTAPGGRRLTVSPPRTT